jgi:hypothetical protein
MSKTLLEAKKTKINRNPEASPENLLPPLATVPEPGTRTAGAATLGGLARALEPGAFTFLVGVLTNIFRPGP